MTTVSRNNDPNLLERAKCPFELFDLWMKQASHSEINDPNAMSVATCSKDGQPNVRILLLKSYSNDGFTFYTNKESQKGLELAENPKVALCFHWKSLRRQVRIRGSVHEVSLQEADAYFASRHSQSQIGAHASAQSRPVASYETFKMQVEAMQHKFQNGDIPRPAHWSGFCLKPKDIEFWQDQPYRLHQRRLFQRQNLDEAWVISWLYP